MVIKKMSQSKRGATFNRSNELYSLDAKRMKTASGQSQNHVFTDIITFGPGSITTFVPGSQVIGLPGTTLSAILQNISDLSPLAANQLLISDGSDDWIISTITADGRSLVGQADTSAMRTFLGLEIGTDVLAYSDALQSISTLAPLTTGSMIYATGTDTFGTSATAAYGRSIVASANSSAARTTLDAVQRAASSTATAIATHNGTNGLSDTAVLIDGGNNLTIPDGSNLVMGTGEMGGITAAERTQLQNIDGTTISSANWGFVSTMDQNVGATDTVVFNKATTTSSTAGGDSGKTLTTKDYVDSIAATGNPPIEQTRYGLALTAAEYPSLSYDAVAQTLTNDSTQRILVCDGVTMTAGDVGARVLVLNSDGIPDEICGIYSITDIGSVASDWVLTRTSDFNIAAVPIPQGSRVFVELGTGGTLYPGTSWALQQDVTSLDPIGDPPSSEVLWTQVGDIPEYTASAGISLVGTDFRIDSPLDVQYGGTGRNTLTSNRVLVGNGTGAVNISKVAPGVFVGTTETQTLTNKTMTDNSFFIQDNITPTRRAVFRCEQVPEGTTNSYTFPPEPGVFVTRDGTQSISNKIFADDTTVFAHNGDFRKRLLFDIGGVSINNDRTWAFPDANDTFVGVDTSQELTNKTFVDNSFVIRDNADATKTVDFQLNGLGSGQNVTLRVPAILTTNTTIVGNNAVQTLTDKTLIDSSTTIESSTGTDRRFVFDASGIANSTTRTVSVPNADFTIVGTDIQQDIQNKVFDSSTVFFRNAGDTKLARFNLGEISPGASRNFTLPSNNTTLVGTDLAQSISSKDLQASSVFFESDDSTRKMRFSVGDISPGTTRVLNVPNASTTLVGTDVSQTLTNKVMQDISNQIRANSLQFVNGFVDMGGNVPPAAGYVLTSTGSTQCTWQLGGGGGGGGGDVIGPGGATDNAIVVFDGPSGKRIKNSLVTISTVGSINLPYPQTIEYDGTDYFAGYGGTATRPNIFAVGNTSATSSATSIGTVLMGYRTGTTNMSGNYITAVGEDALANVTSGGQNTGFGAAAGFNIQSGVRNTLLGYEAGGPLVNGSDNVFIGDNADAQGVSTSESIGIGNNTTSADGCTVVGTNAASNNPNAIVIGKDAIGTTDSITVGVGSISNASGIVIGKDSTTGTNSITIGNNTILPESNTCAIGGSGVDAIEEIRVAGLDVDIGIGPITRVAGIYSGRYRPSITSGFTIPASETNDFSFVRIGTHTTVWGLVQLPLNWSGDGEPTCVIPFPFTATNPRVQGSVISDIGEPGSFCIAVATEDGLGPPITAAEITFKALFSLNESILNFKTVSFRFTYNNRVV